MIRRYDVVVTAAAERDLRETRAYIAEDSPAAARAWVATLRERILSLESLPMRGALLPEVELAGAGYRHVLVGDYRIIYRIDAARVVVVRVVHGARLLDIPAGA